ncbi:TIGR04255 family protein [Vibrio splendidus]|uniref:TIGR04255 family protein n=1 Tax=Vibrio splendidus TaxID=29497 RepID=UPI000C818CBB|nr:TIGR04255 family protein [Vibrio splendidus]PMJ93379.1 hypothetical protein BCU10_10550 [Vibrio splendidus]
MSGYFEKAPLVYVVGRIKTTELAPLLAEQVIHLQQVMSESDFIYASEDTVTKLEFNISPEDGSTTKTTPHARRCYHSPDKRTSLVVEPDAVEYRTTDYQGFDDFISKFKSVLSQLNKAFNFYHNALVQEITLSYVDVVASFDEQYKLSNFFSDSIVLPLESQSKYYQGDIIQMGKLDFSRVIETNLKVYVSLEQLPIKAGKLIPDLLMENCKAFGMPIALEKALAESTDNHYALLMSQASTLPSEDTKLVSFDFGLFDKVHTHSKEIFLNMLNRDVSDNVWVYKERA